MAMLPCLQRRLKVIVVVNGAEDPNCDGLKVAIRPRERRERERWGEGGGSGKRKDTNVTTLQ